MLFERPGEHKVNQFLIILAIALYFMLHVATKHRGQ